ncbi:hypothetical protein L1987_48670 [Smallanthus sonchifolius]|uniref:Uncharacterized protein n=1 Tax=Smallanthus sonchifolius TaxID=185202 RepID=A0ACB9FT35_9ASTR|nr:hypothetical protein L1987_48670 [Smallanthus sonchifolius]
MEFSLLCADILRNQEEKQWQMNLQSLDVPFRYYFAEIRVLFSHCFGYIESLEWNNVIAKDVTKYYKMNPKNVEGFGGVDHAEYCFQESNETKKVVAWEKAFIQLVEDELVPMVESKNLTLSYSSESSIEEELKRKSEYWWEEAGGAVAVEVDDDGERYAVTRFANWVFCLWG